MQQEHKMITLDQWIEKRRNKKSYRQLRDLSPHLLADIGIGSTELETLRQGRPVRR